MRHDLIICIEKAQPILAERNSKVFFDSRFLDGCVEQVFVTAKTDSFLLRLLLLYCWLLESFHSVQLFMAQNDTVVANKCAGHVNLR